MDLLYTILRKVNSYMKEWLKRKDREFSKTRPVSAYQEWVFGMTVMTIIVLFDNIVFPDTPLSWEFVPVVFAMMGILFMFRWWIRRE